MITQQEIISGLQKASLHKKSAVIVHSSLRSFGYVEGGASTVCRALLATCGTLLLPATSYHLTRIPAPPGLIRPYNAVNVANTWDEFDNACANAIAFSLDLPISREQGIIPETMRREFSPHRSSHPLMSYIAIGEHAQELLAAQRLDWPLGPIEALAQRGGDILLLGVSHTSNTAIHLAEQLLGRACFYRYARGSEGTWMELSNIPGDSHHFDDIEPFCAPFTEEVMIGKCRARRIAISDLLAITQKLIMEDPKALLCDDKACRCFAAYQQRLLKMAGR